MHLDEMIRVYDAVALGLGVRRGESIYDAARRARYHGHERASASAIILDIRDEWSPEAKWALIAEAALVLQPRLERDRLEWRRRQANGGRAGLGRKRA